MTPCRDCLTEPAVTRVGTVDLCSNCVELLLAPIRIRVAERAGIHGVAQRIGRNRPDHGPGYAECACTSCSSTWCAPVGAACPWCADWARMAHRVSRRLQNAHRTVKVRSAVAA
jgi:hypothetical protein